ncbi:prolyl oligopeptidase family serine peptidase [Lentzea sp. BCCO 10_0061]|uniref:Prolyl oligopeptidase family serine peptidase n=1 Tax=Lentzea sokolovensis TaxID=3095429 RepID=A0ABU4VBL9_9PSEU|nr:prolyl oligopeptidase family serine peptidase [Lentzea sp. BCCO 10_0061]MDX8149099.1 prolyl oligopeptidase family serine peptidase [Lentzea sp. BCCO 10_0061]
MQLLMAAVLAASTLVTPQLSGPFAVGTFDAHLTDSTRADPWQPTKNRELMVTISYPARRTGQQAPWLGTTLATALDPIISSPAYLDIPTGTVDWAGTRRQARDARPLPGRWPVVLFSPGLQSPREFYAGAADDLASRGYVVVTVSHTHETVAVEFPGNRIEWGLMQDAGQATMKKAIDTRVADMRFVLSELPKLHNGADTSRVGIAGHSYGGYTAAETMANDRRFDAGINIDGAMEHTGDDGPYAPGKAVIEGLDRPFLLFGGDLGERELSHVDTSLTRTWADFWPNQRGWKRDVHLDDGAHLGFSDMQWSVPQIGAVPTERRESLIGTIDSAAALKAQHDYVAAFFDLHLKHRGTRLFERARHEGIRLVP